MAPAPALEGTPGAPVQVGSSTFVYGGPRPLVNLVLFALAEEASPQFHWLDLDGPGPGESGFGPARDGWIPAERLWSVAALPRSSPSEQRAPHAFFELVRADEPPELLARLAAFLTLPPALQRILGSIASGGERSALAVANADRLATVLPMESLPPILAAFDSMGCTLLAGFTSRGRPATVPFDRILRVDSPGGPTENGATIVLEHGPAWGPLWPGRPHSVRELPALRRLLERVDAHRPASSPG